MALDHMGGIWSPVVAWIKPYACGMANVAKRLPFVMAIAIASSPFPYDRMANWWPVALWIT